ncbi:MAG: ABC transporter permease [Bryobacteraceae bacterium]
MTITQFARRNLSHYRRTNLAVMLGVAAAVAVLSGALLVGDSVRGSLRDLVAQRLGHTSYVVSSMLFFRDALAKEIPSSVPLIALEGVAVHDSDKRASSAQVYGVDDRFWKFNGVTVDNSGGDAHISSALAAEIGAKTGDTILVRIEKPSAIPKESMHGRKDDSTRVIRFQVGSILDAAHLGEFSLRPTQGSVRAVFLPLRRLQRDLVQQGKANTLLTSGPSPLTELRAKATLADLGVKVRSIPESNALSVESEAAVINDALLEAVEATGAPTVPMLSYLANSIRIGDREVPYSLVVAIDPAQLPAGAQRDSIYLNDWAAKDLGAKTGDEVTLDYYFWEPSGTLTTRQAKFHLAAVLPMSGLATDRNLTPDYPGITDADSVGDWDPPFPLDLKRVRPKDEAYWKQYRTSPKAFLTLEAGQALWASRFGKLTTIRIPGTSDASAFAAKLRAKVDPERAGMAVVDVRTQGAGSAKGSTDFGEYFTYFSFFLVISALLLTALFFQLGIEQRLREIGTLRAVGFSAGDVRKLFLTEGVLLAVVGCVVGTVTAIAYSALLMYGLRTVWRDAVNTSLLSLHVDLVSLAIGAVSGAVIAILTILLTLRSLRKSTARDLMMGVRGSSVSQANPRRATWLAIGSAVAGALILGAAVSKQMDATGGFFGAGFFFLMAALFFLWARLRARGHSSLGMAGSSSLWKLGFRNATYRPARSILCITLIASATFLLVALDAFRRPAASPLAKDSGTGGYPLMAESRLPVFYNLNTNRDALNLSTPDARFTAFRLRPGDDASCLNLYEPRNPRILGAPGAFLKEGRFDFQSSLAQSDAEKKNPWLLLEKPGDAIPAAVDANSLEYVIHKKLGDEWILNAESEHPVRLRIVASLSDSIFQSEVIVSEANFLRAFPEQQGFRVFLIDAPVAELDQVSAKLEESLSEYGFDATSTVDKLAAFHRVENTYLSTFQVLGGLGLLLGTVGLAAVLLRNVLERRRELALLRAVGYQTSDLGITVLAENVFLLACGLIAGVLCALLAIAPAIASRGQASASGLPWLLVAVPVVSLAASALAVRAVARAPLLASLRAE